MKTDQIKGELRSYLVRARQLAENSNSQTTSAFSKVIDGVSGQLVGEAVRTYGLGNVVSPRTASSAMRKGLENRRKKEGKDREKRQAADLDQVVKQVQTTLKSVSRICPSLTTSGNSRQLLEKMAKVHQYKTIKGKTLHLISVLEEISDYELISNDELPLFIAQRTAHYGEEANQIITSLERAIRSLVRAKLSSTPNWWIDRIPEQTRRRAEQRKAKEESLYPSLSAPEDALSFVSFTDYDDIILSNWEIFSGVFKEKEWISVQLKELEPLRNNLMHSRQLTEHGLEKLRVISREVLARIDSVNK
jgi:hypothetical protein